MRTVLLLAALLAACAQAPLHVAEESLVPGTIGVTVRQDGSAVVVSAVRKGSKLQVGDVVLRYNGEPVDNPRQFYRLMVDSAPGSRVRLEVLREGNWRTLEVPVRELDTVPRARIRGAHEWRRT